ncbi:MAG: tetratricopeptide repeat protein [Deltaproteobacteria bacterium]|nr:tetratricopeptide repeat protein [Deltaproteobacteria bacterium]
MRPSRIVWIAILLFPIALFFLLPSSGLAQKTSGGEGILERSPQAEDFDKKALEKLRKFPPREVEELDRKLAEALTLFYDREFARALPIFREISGRVETMDVMFWTASCAAGAGETEAAIDKFKQMLLIDPNLHRVRLELATTYFGVGRYDDARQELNKVLEAGPPEPVKNNIQKLLAAIDEKTKRVFANVRGSLGIQYDTNVSAGPDKEFINIPLGGGTLGPLTNTQKKLSDYVTVANASGNVLYDFGDKGSWMWNTTGSFYNTHNMKYYEFDYAQFRVTTGLWHVGEQSVWKFPAGWAYNSYGHEDLYDSYDFTPSYEYFFTPNFSLQGLFSYMRDTYVYSAVPADNRTGEDAVTRTIELNPNFYFNNRKDILSFYVNCEDSNAKDHTYTYDAYNLAVSYFKSFNIFDWDMEFYTRFKYTKRDYKEPSLLWPPDYDRRDKRTNFYLVLSRNFSKNLFASISYNWINNGSNTELYDFEKFVYAFNIGFRF